MPNEILMYMQVMLEAARERDILITRDSFRDHGRETPLFLGLKTWFDRINGYGRARGLAIEHYIIYSGTHEMIEGSPIASQFKAIYAWRFIYDGHGEAVWLT